MTGSSQDVHKDLDLLSAEIRQLKADLKKQGLSSSEINRHQAVLDKVFQLQELKKKLDSTDPARDEIFFERQREERKVAQKQKQADMQAQTMRLKAVEERAPQPLIQRKIFHLFAHRGTKATFHYEQPPRLNGEDCGFGVGDNPHPPVYITEKWDGTTMQATSTHIFKRTDLWGKRRDGNASQRYGLRLLAWREDPAGGWQGLDFIDSDSRLAEALSLHLDRLASLEPGLCVYFEAVHTDINVNFKHMPGFADIRVFDFSRANSDADGGRFLPFEETIRLAALYDLPMVGWARTDQLDCQDVWQQLVCARAESRPYATAAATIEGFVVRQAGSGGRIAKARLEHLVPQKPLEASADDSKARSKAGLSPESSSAAASGKMLGHSEHMTRASLQAIGLIPQSSDDTADRPILLRSRVQCSILRRAD